MSGIVARSTLPGTEGDSEREAIGIELRGTAVAEGVERESAALEGRGRVLVRPSGTEQLVRVMVEAPTSEEADAVCDRLVATVDAA